MDGVEEDDEKGNIYIIDQDGKLKHTEDNGKSYLEKFSQLEQPQSNDSDDHSSSGNIIAVDTSDDAPVQKRTLFGPPSWNPEQLATAIKAVLQEGVSLTNAARDNGIPRTTLANKIYGRKRRSTTQDSSSSTVTSSTFTNQRSHSSNLTRLLGPDHESTLAGFLSRQRHVDSYSMTRAVFDVVKYFARDKGIMLLDDDEIADWMKQFFLRHPASRFTVWHIKHGRYDSEDTPVFVDFVQENSKSFPAEEVKRNLFSLVKQKLHLHVHLFWWYSYLTRHMHIKNYFLENLKWPESIFDDCRIENKDDEIVCSALTNILLNRHQLVNSLSGNRSNFRVSTAPAVSYPIVTANSNIHVINNEHTDSPTQVSPRRSYDTSKYKNILPKNNPRERITTSEDRFEHDVNISSSTSASCKTPSYSVMLAQEALQAVERKLSAENLQYFKRRYENPQLDEAYQIWKNLKTASEKQEYAGEI